jgi:hypothetical protein
MPTIEGYYDGKTFVPLEQFSIKPNQKVQITVLDDYLTEEKAKAVKEMKNKNREKK